MRPPQARKRKGRLLDAGGQMMTPELLYDNQSRIGHIFLVSPTFDITKPGKFFFIAFAGQSYDSLAFLHLRGQIFMRTGSYPGASLFRRIRYGRKNNIYILFVAGICHNHSDSIVVFHFFLKLYTVYINRSRSADLEQAPSALAYSRFLCYIHCMSGITSANRRRASSEETPSANTSKMVSSPANVPNISSNLLLSISYAI